MSNRTGFSAQLWVQEDGDWSQLSDAVMISFPQKETAKVKTSNLGSAGHTHTYTVGWTEPGTFSAEFHFSKSLYDTLDVLHGEVLNYMIVHIDEAEEITVEAFMFKGPDTTFDMNDELSKIKCEFQSSGVASRGSFSAGLLE